MHTLLQTLQVYKFKNVNRKKERYMSQRDPLSGQQSMPGLARGKQSLIFYSAACEKFGPDSGGFKTSYCR